MVAMILVDPHKASQPAVATDVLEEPLGSRCAAGAVPAGCPVQRGRDAPAALLRGVMARITSSAAEVSPVGGKATLFATCATRGTVPLQLPGNCRRRAVDSACPLLRLATA